MYEFERGLFFVIFRPCDRSEFVIFITPTSSERDRLSTFAFALGAPSKSLELVFYEVEQEGKKPVN